MLPLPQVESATPVLDAFARPLRSLRISVTDRCNLRCQYCMPEKEYIWLDRREILSFEEIAELTSIFTGLGVDKVRLTGGEPLLRQNLDHLVRMLARNPQIHDLALTTNGMLLAQQAWALREAGLARLTVSLDTLRPERFRALTQRDALDQVRGGLRAAYAAGFTRLKINCVVIRDFNHDEISDLIEFGRETGSEVRFIEYMDVGGATRWTPDQVFPRAAILETLKQRYGPVQALDDLAPEKSSSEQKSSSEKTGIGDATNARSRARQAPSEGAQNGGDGSEHAGRSSNGRGTAKAPADRYLLPDGTAFGIISSTTQPFCRTCDRARLTPDGMWLLCLYAKEGLDLKRLLRGGASSEQIARTMAEVWRARTDRGAEERLHMASRGVLFQIEDLRRDPHREMHTRGG
jgi:GTP 3',8-cyclase